jgi:glycosyltransferase involved in cell wall biosynthesis
MLWVHDPRIDDFRLTRPAPPSVASFRFGPVMLASSAMPIAPRALRGERPFAPDLRQTASEGLLRVATDQTIARATRPLRIALIGSYAPRACGIATFTAHVEQALRSDTVAVDIWPVRQVGEALADPRAMIEGDLQSFRSAAKAIEHAGTDVVLLQHEFGLFGGSAGDAVLALVEALSIPLIVTFHTVLAEPDADQRRVMNRLALQASQIVVMAERSRRILIETYGVGAERISVIEHGVPDRPFGRSADYKAKLGFDGPVLLTFGLLSPGKGIETAIAALPAIVAQHPSAIYCIAGATHPNLVAREGEAYRERLQQLARASGVEKNIRWIDAFLDQPDLLDLIEAADIYITPYPGAGQSTSGTLSYAVALGKAVISTPYVHATELLADGNGILVGFGDAQAIADAANRLLDDPARLLTLQQRAYARGRQMLWTNYAARMVAQAEAARIPTSPAQAYDKATLPLAGVLRLCDDCGIMQHSRGLVPDRRHGYCIDDNARALMLFNRLAPDADGHVERLTLRFAGFVDHAWNQDRKVFRNFMSYARVWLEDEGSEDSNGRGLWALGTTAREGREPGLRAWAGQLFGEALPTAKHWGSPRALAFAMLGAVAYLEAEPGHAGSLDLLRHGVTTFQSLLAATRRPDWPWFELMLAYDNPRLPEALIRAGSVLGDAAAVTTGIETLQWIAEQQTSAGRGFRPVGSDSFGRIGLPPLPFDQQPLEAWAMIEACVAAFEMSVDLSWVQRARSAYGWYLGDNDRGIALADLATGLCCDGLTPRGSNGNSGAESVLAFQLAHVAMQAFANDDGESTRIRAI